MLAAVIDSWRGGGDKSNLKNVLQSTQEESCPHFMGEETGAIHEVRRLAKASAEPGFRISAASLF